MSSKPLTDGKQSLLLKGPKFTICSPKVHLTEYIAVTKRIYDELGENTVGKDCTEIYQKTKEILQHFKNKKGHTCNITKEEKEAIKTLREDASHMVLTADKRLALVVIHKTNMLINVWPFLMTLRSTNLSETPRNCTEKSSKPLTAQNRPWG